MTPITAGAQNRLAQRKERGRVMLRAMFFSFPVVVFFMLWATPTISLAKNATTYIVTDLGPGLAYDINSFGRVVGEGFYWDPVTGRQNIDINLFGINDLGMAVGLMGCDQRSLVTFTPPLELAAALGAIAKTRPTSGWLERPSVPTWD